MRHRIAGRKLGRTTAHRQAMMRNLSTALLDKERITTTLTKAKELRRFAERLVTLSKRETLHARRLVLRHIHDRKVVAKLFDTLSARYSERPGGYTRIIKLGPRRGDNAEMALVELVGAELTKADDADGADEKPAAKAATRKSGKSGKNPKKKTAAKKTTADKTAKAGTKKKVAKKKATKKKTTKKKTTKKKTSE